MRPLSFLYRSQRSLMALALVFASSACTQLPPGAYMSGAGPERLLDVSTEEVSVSLQSPNSVDQLVQWVNQDQPSRVQLACDGSAEMCSQAKDVLDQFSVPYEEIEGGPARATLVYERVLARDCDHEFRSNHINPYNLSYPGFGCSNAVNALQMIADKRQIVAPSLSGYQDADKAAQGLGNYRKPSEDALSFERIFQQ